MTDLVQRSLTSIPLIFIIYLSLSNQFVLFLLLIVISFFVIVEMFNLTTKILNELKKGPFYLRIGLLPVEKSPMRNGSIVYIDKEGDREIGIITSGGYSPTLNKPISMGRIQSKYIKELEKVYVKVRGKLLPAKITKLPFIKTNYKN